MSNPRTDPQVGENIKEAKQKIKEARRALREAERKLQHWFGRIEPDILDELVESTLSLMNEARELSQRLQNQRQTQRTRDDA